MSLTREEYLHVYKTMRLIREFEEAVRRLHAAGVLPGFLHVSVGQEAVPAGVSLALRDDDLIISTHRGHGDVIAKGASIEGMFAEIFGRAGGLCRAKGGSMHVADVSLGILGANGIVAAGMPIAVGAGLSLKRQGSEAVVVCYCGDGAIASGTSHEALNMAALWHVPVVFVRVNNQYAESTPVAVYQGMPDVVPYVEGYGIRAERVFGNDVEAVADAARRLLVAARGGERPAFLECVTYRKYGHNIGDTAPYRPAEEVESWLARDPIELARTALLDARGVDAEVLAKIDATAVNRIEEAIAYAEALPEPPEEWAFEDVYADPGILPVMAGAYR